MRLLRLAPALLVITSASAGAQTVVRGPYLQRATPTSIVVRWRTDVATDSRVRWGPVVGAPAFAASDGAMTTEHAVTLSGLAPSTQAFYDVGTTSTVLAGGDAAFSFETAPPRGADVPVRVWVVGDAGTCAAGAQYCDEPAAVRDAFLAFSAGEPPDLWLMLGDIAYYSGLDGEYQAGLFEVFLGVLRSLVSFPAIGNHDATLAPTLAYEDIFDLPAAGEGGGVASGSELYYSFDWGPVHFVALDTSIDALAADGPLAQWLVADLMATRQPWVVAYAHHPPYTKGSHDSDSLADSGGRMTALRENLLPFLEAAGVDLFLAGHSHAYERSFLLAGHYDVSATLDPAMVLDAGDGDPAGDGPYAKPELPGEGTVYAVVGSSGWVTANPLDGSGDPEHPAMRTAAMSLGSLVLDVDGNRLEGRFLDETGAVLDRFAIDKAWRLFRDGFESGGVAAWSWSVPGG